MDSPAVPVSRKLAQLEERCETRSIEVTRECQELSRRLDDFSEQFLAYERHLERIERDQHAIDARLGDIENIIRELREDDQKMSDKIQGIAKNIKGW